MSRRPARVTEADIHRAAKVAKRVGMAVEIATDGTIRLVPISEKEQEQKVELDREIVL
jgi:hypothetical protein